MLSNEHHVRTDCLAGTLHKFTFYFETGRCYRNASEENPNEPANSWRSFDRERFPPQCEGWFMPFKSEAQGRYCEANKNKLERQGSTSRSRSSQANA
jgi:hypothetical protein